MTTRPASHSPAPARPPTHRTGSSGTGFLPRGSRWPPVTVIAPSEHGFVHVGAESGTWHLPVALPSRRRRALLRRFAATARSLRTDERVLRADLFTAAVRPPGGRTPAGAQPARYDVVLLVETVSPSAATELAGEDLLTALTRAAGRGGRRVLSFAASNARRIGPVDHDRPGVFLFNYFSAPSVRVNLAAWQYTAGWFQVETGLDNSTVLEPAADADVPYAVVNHARWDRLRDVLPPLLTDGTFHTFVLRVFAGQGVTPEPLLYRPWTSRDTGAAERGRQR